MRSGTHEPLFHRVRTLDNAFEKVAATVSRVPDDDKKWPAHIYSELLRELPYLSQYDVDVVLDRVDAEAGAALGYAQVRSKTLSRPQDNISSPGNIIRIPIVVQDRRIEKFLVFETGKQLYPLTEDRVQQALLNPCVFDTDATRLPVSGSLIDQLYPPYQQRQGFGRVTEPAAMGLDKLSSARKEPNARHLALAQQYQMDPHFIANDVDDPKYPDALEHNVAFESALQKHFGGPGIPWDAKKWGHPHPHTQGNVKAAELKATLAGWRPEQASAVEKIARIFGASHPSPDVLGSPALSQADRENSVISYGRQKANEEPTARWKAILGGAGIGAVPGALYGGAIGGMRGAAVGGLAGAALGGAGGAGMQRIDEKEINRWRSAKKKGPDAEKGIALKRIQDAIEELSDDEREHRRNMEVLMMHAATRPSGDVHHHYHSSPSTSSSAPKSERRRCGHCGAESSSGTGNCASCGAPMSRGTKLAGLYGAVVGATGRAKTAGLAHPGALASIGGWATKGAQRGLSWATGKAPGLAGRVVPTIQKGLDLAAAHPKAVGGALVATPVVAGAARYAKASPNERQRMTRDVAVFGALGGV